MANTDRGTHNSLIEYLELQAPRYDFFNAVRLLELLSHERNPVGYDSDPGQEAVRFRISPSMSFPASSIKEITSKHNEYSPQVLMTVLFFGLYGRHGALPWHYTSKITAEEKQGNPALRSFYRHFQPSSVVTFLPGRNQISVSFSLQKRRTGSPQ